jgi:hypothetical protein
VSDRTLLDATSDLGIHYKKWKSEEKEKNTFKDEFFDLVTVLVQGDDYELEEKLVLTDAPDEDSARKHFAMYYPRYLIDEIRPADERITEGLGNWEAILTENPEYISWQYINPDDGMVYTKSVQDGSLMLDDERLAEEDPILYESLFWDAPWGDRMMMPLDKLSPTKFSKIKRFVYNAKPQVKLLAPRKAKADELEAIS